MVFYVLNTDSDFGLNLCLPSRPGHLANQLITEGCLIFCEVLIRAHTSLAPSEAEATYMRAVGTNIPVRISSLPDR
jgi:hypothetical protein